MDAYEYYKGVRGIIEYARMQRRLREDKSQFKPLYYHVEYHTDKGTEVEMHYRPSFLCSPVRNMRMLRWFKEQFDICLKNKCQLGFPVLTSTVNVVYQLVHLYRHVFEGGIGLRQLMDYYFALRVWHNDVMECKDLQSQGMWSEGLGMPVMSATEVMAVLRSFGMGKFAGAVMWVIHEVFGGVDEKFPQMNTDGHGCPQADGGGEHELPQINRELKENNIYPQIYTDGHRCPQADGGGERELFTHCQTKEEFIKLRKFSRIYSHIANIKKSSSSSASFRELKEIGPQAGGDGEQQLFASSSSKSKFFTHCQYKEEFIKLKQVSASGQQLSKKYYAPWMICEPNVKEGRKLLAEIMQGGNFGQYDTRDAALKRGGMVKHGVWKLKRVMRLVSSYPEEAMWEPVFRVYHLFWRFVH